MAPHLSYTIAKTSRLPNSILPTQPLAPEKTNLDSKARINLLRTEIIVLLKRNQWQVEEAMLLHCVVNLIGTLRGSHCCLNFLAQSSFSTVHNLKPSSVFVEE